MNSWRGPAKIIGIDENCVTIKHGGSVVQCHPRDVRKIRTMENFRNESNEQNSKQLMTNVDGKDNGANDNNIFVNGGDLSLNFKNEIRCHACQSKDMTRAHLIVQFVNDQIQNSKKDNSTLFTRLCINWNGAALIELLEFQVICFNCSFQQMDRKRRCKSLDNMGHSNDPIFDGD